MDAWQFLTPVKGDTITDIFGMAVTFNGTEWISQIATVNWRDGIAVTKDGWVLIYDGQNWI